MHVASSGVYQDTPVAIARPSGAWAHLGACPSGSQDDGAHLGTRPSGAWGAWAGGILSTGTISAGSAPGTTAGTREPCLTAGSASAGRGHGHTWERASPGRKTTERVPPGRGQRGAGGT